VFKSPDVVIEGKDTVPAGKVTGEVKLTPKLFTFVIAILYSC
jgi:hypothetical protein